LSRRLRVLWLTVFVVFSLVACGPEGAQEEAEDYPSDRITMLVPYAAGGPTDLSARAVADYFEQEFGQTVGVENREGASGAIATNELVSAAPDGYTIGVIAAPATVVVPMMEDVAYEVDDFQPVAGIMEMPAVLAVRSDSPYGSAEEFFEAAEQEPGSLNVGTPGATTSQSIELRRLNENYEPEVEVIPFDGNSELVSGLLGGNIDALFTVASEDILSQIEAGEFEPLAVSPEQRVDFLPDVPTLSELGFEDLTLSTSIFGLAVPRDTPPEIVERLEETTRAALEDPAVVDRIGENYVPSEFITGEDLRNTLEEIRDAYEPIVGEE
jgi:tripartite-type tricarboxylate transporter receptor subunit TctC